MKAVLSHVQGAQFPRDMTTMLRLVTTLPLADKAAVRAATTARPLRAGRVPSGPSSR